MKILRILIPLLLIFPVAHAARPRLYVTGQIGQFNADAGTLAALGSPLPNAGSVKSGMRTFSDLAIGVEALDWLSVEAGYVDFASFISREYTFGMPFLPQALWNTYDLQGFRLTPVLNVVSKGRFNFRVLGGLTLATGEVIVRDRFSKLNPTVVAHKLATGSYHIGIGATCHLARSAALEARILRYDFGKPKHYPSRITAMMYSLGLSWRF
jgi:hypothetical protein